MKIMYMNHRYHTNQAAIMKGWIENGHEVEFVSHFMGKIEDYTYVKPTVIGYSKLFLVFDYLYTHVLKRGDPRAMDMKIKYGIPPMFKLARCIKKFQPDVVILRERSNYTICMNAICRYYKIPAILYNQSPVWEKPVKRDFLHRLVWKLTPKFRISPVDLMGVNYNGLVKDPFASWVPFVMEPQLAPEKKTFFLGNRINILCIGKYQPRKNLQMMMEAVEELLPAYNLHLTIAGEVSNPFHEEYYKKLTDYAESHHLKEHITFHVNLNRDQIYEEYQKADVFVLPSTNEPAAVSHLEAMSFSLPVVCSSGNGTANYVVNDKNGYIFCDNDKSDLIMKLEHVIRDQSRLVEMGAASYQYILEKFQFDSYFKAIDRIYREITG